MVDMELDIEKVADKVDNNLVRELVTGWLIEHKTFRPKAYLACASSKLCEFIWFSLYDVLYSLQTTNKVKKHKTC